MLLQTNKENRLSCKKNSLIQGYMNLFCFSEKKIASKKETKVHWSFTQKSKSQLYKC